MEIASSHQIRNFKGKHIYQRMTVKTHKINLLGIKNRSNFALPPVMLPSRSCHAPVTLPRSHEIVNISVDVSKKYEIVKKT